MKRIVSTLFLSILITTLGMSQIQKSVFQTGEEELEIWHIGHGSLMLQYKGKVIHIDPFSTLTDYTTLPKADLILITHEHADHLDPKAIETIRKEGTDFILTSVCYETVMEGQVIANGENTSWNGIQIEAVPAYNIVHKRPDGKFYHPKGIGNGYVLTVKNLKVYVAGDTEDIPEMKNLNNIDVAFLPMNLPYTMTPEMTAIAARMFRPKVLYPYHYGNTDTNKLVELLKDDTAIDVRIR